MHTNGNLFLSQGAGATLTLTRQGDRGQGDRPAAAAERRVDRHRAGPRPAPSSMATSPGDVPQPRCGPKAACVDGLRQRAERADVAHDLAQRLQQLDPQRPDRRQGAEPAADHGRRHQPRPDPAAAGQRRRHANAVLFSERLFTKASLRILLSDTAADITSLPTVTGTAPVLLDGDWHDAAEQRHRPLRARSTPTHPPIARSPGPLPVTHGQPRDRDGPIP